jgi:HlyD family secretion protein
MRKWLIGIGVVVVLVLAFFGFRMYQNNNASAQAEWQTEVAGINKLTASIGATGRIRANQTGDLVFNTSGVVDDVWVKAGSEVERDQVLASIARTSLPAQVILAEADLVAAERALDDLLNSNLALAQAEQALAVAMDELKDAEYRRRVYQEGSRANSDTIAAAEARLELAEDQVKEAETVYSRVSGELPQALARIELTNAREARDAALRSLNWYKGKPTEIDQMLLDADVSSAEAKVADAQREVERLADGPTQADITATQARIDAARATLEQAQINAPFSGTITGINIMPGDQASPGKVAFRLADLTRLLVDVEVSEVDINQIELGQSVSIELDASPGRVYQGEVVEIAQDSQPTQGVVNYLVTVEIIDPDEEIKPGMTAAVSVIVSSLDNVLLVPNRAVRLFDGERVVYIVQDGELMPVTVILGASSDLYSEVVGGDLKEGDLIVLNPPTEFQQNGPPPFFGGG